jgi:hypothetical protein
MEECEARTQGAFVSGGYGRNRGRGLVPSGAVRRLVLMLWEPLSLFSALPLPRAGPAPLLGLFDRLAEGRHQVDDLALRLLLGFR